MAAMLPNHTNARDDLIEYLFQLQLSQRDILSCLTHYGFTVSARHLRRILASRRLRRGEYADLIDTALFIDTQLAASGKLHGYRWMWEKLKENGLIARKEDVRLILTFLDPDGVASRCVRKRIGFHSYHLEQPYNPEEPKKSSQWKTERYVSRAKPLQYTIVYHSDATGGNWTAPRTVHSAWKCIQLQRKEGRKEVYFEKKNNDQELALGLKPFLISCSSVGVMKIVDMFRGCGCAVVGVIHGLCLCLRVFVPLQVHVYQERQ
ncbi:hypothetical protein CAPTEDRAFT_217314 [Capitella teleta]|uniref:Uncharacterized protein n=1 Tax=Capitella teleta TaxID=283909 RepID=R7TZ99_CAPTE|nr:hypothetical protein CAPTEDRAFT_217314 [Capitella teleta]|eukprot:ELT99089.1 hypothetical protein CAPTEDRAFT_217314 [Capitella teleta]